MTLLTSPTRVAPTSRRLRVAMGCLLLTDLAGGLLAVASGLNTWGEAWGARALLAAPLPMIGAQLLLTWLATRRRAGRRAADRSPARLPGAPARGHRHRRGARGGTGPCGDPPRDPVVTGQPCARRNLPKWGTVKATVPRSEE